MLPPIRDVSQRSPVIVIDTRDRASTYAGQSYLVRRSFLRKMLQLSFSSSPGTSMLKSLLVVDRNVQMSIQVSIHHKQRSACFDFRQFYS